MDHFPVDHAPSLQRFSDLYNAIKNLNKKQYAFTENFFYRDFYADFFYSCIYSTESTCYASTIERFARKMFQ